MDIVVVLHLLCRMASPHDKVNFVFLRSDDGTYHTIGELKIDSQKIVHLTTLTLENNVAIKNYVGSKAVVSSLGDIRGRVISTISQ